MKDDTTYTPGTLIHNHPDFKYHSAPGLSSGAIRCFYRQSPLHYRKAYLDRELPRKETEAMLLGTLVHCLVLEPDSFEQRYQRELDLADYPEALRTVAEMKKYCEKHRLPTTGVKSELIARIQEHDETAPVWDLLVYRQKEQTKQEVIKTGLWDKARRMRDGVFANADVANLFKDGKPEVSVWGQHDSTGIITKCRSDWLRDEDGLVVDLKTCACSSPEFFAKACADHDYAMQQVHYMETLASAGYPQEVFAFVAIESEEPYICQPYFLDDRSIHLTEDVYHTAMERLRVCTEQNIWPTYTDQSELSLPVWKLKQLEKAA